MWKSDRAVPARQHGRVNPVRCRPQVSCWNTVRSVNFRVLEVFKPFKPLGRLPPQNSKTVSANGRNKSNPGNTNSKVAFNIDLGDSHQLRV